MIQVDEIRLRIRPIISFKQDETMARFSFVLLCHILHVFRVEARHFYGGTVTWKPMNNSGSQNIVDVMFTQSYQWKRSWTSGTSSGFCNQTTILNRSPKIPASNDKLTCVTSACSGFQGIPIDEYCTDFSTLVDSSSGQTFEVQYFDVGSKFCVAFQDSAWIRVLSTECGTTGKKRREVVKRATNTTPLCFSNSAKWSIGTCLDLTVRPEGFINTPPVATVISRKDVHSEEDRCSCMIKKFPFVAVKAEINTITDIQLPVIDYDGDFLR